MGDFANISVSGVRIDTALLDKITVEMKPKASKVVNTYGVIMAGQAAKNAPVDTSALRNSILSESSMVGDLTYAIQDGVEYGYYQEFGTSKMAAQPFLIPAIEQWKDDFMKAFKGLFP